MRECQKEIEGKKIIEILDIYTDWLLRMGAKL